MEKGPICAESIFVSNLRARSHQLNYLNAILGEEQIIDLSYANSCDYPIMRGGGREEKKGKNALTPSEL